PYRPARGLGGAVVDGQQVAASALGQRISVLKLVEGGSVVAVLQVSQLVHDQVVDDPIWKGGGPRRDPDCASGESAAPPQVRDFRKRDRGPAQPAAEVAVVQRASARRQLVVRRSRSLHAPLETLTHLLGPPLALGAWH